MPNMNQAQFTTGTCNSTTITFYAGSADFLAPPRKVLLSANYQRSPPPAFPDANPGIAISTSPTAYPQTIPSGATVAFFAPEAAAIVAAAGGAYA